MSSERAKEQCRKRLARPGTYHYNCHGTTSTSGTNRQTGTYMNQLIYPRDRVLTAVTLILGILIWVGVAYAVFTVGGARAITVAVTTVLTLSIIGSLAYLFAQSAFVAHLRGNGLEVSDTQLPELFSQFAQCCEKLSITKRPSIYIQNGNGVLNAFATWFLGRKYVVLLSTVVDAMDKNPNGIRFYVGHELGHVVRHDNPVLWALRWPALRFPLIGASFSRARESTCDLHGLACSESREGAARSLVALSAGAKRWQGVSLEGLGRQVNSARGFWMSFHELTASYPWNAKRVIRILHEKPEVPRRNPFAFVLAAFIPYAGRLGSGLGLLLYVYVIGVLAAIAIPAYQDYGVRATLTEAMGNSQHARDALGSYYLGSKQIPASLPSIGIDEKGPRGLTMSLNPKDMVLTVNSMHGSLIFTPSMSGDGRIVWTCSGGPEVKPGQVPRSCR
jgi:Zn-dependent protease with chaperone function/type II secretory pathway pseudopilin PulG